MMLLLTLALIFSGHLLRVWRWRLLARPFVAARNGHYFLALAVGYVANALIPLRLGEILRAWVFSRLTRIPFSHALGTVVIDRATDILVVTVLFLLTVQAGLFNATPFSIALSLFILTALPAAGALLVMDSPLIKTPAARIAALFNPCLERGLLAVLWSTRLVLIHFLASRSTPLFVALTFAMWSFYLGAIIAFIAALHQPLLMGSLTLWGSIYLTSPGLPPLLSSFTQITPTTAPVTGFLLLGFAPLFAIALYLVVRNRARLHRKPPSGNVLRLNLFMQPEDEHTFLTRWARNQNPAGLLTAFRENQDIAIMKDLSGGSQARTLLAQQSGNVFYRKYALGADEAARLEQQKNWLDHHAGHLALPPILQTRSANGYFSYDMPYDPAAYTFYEYIHTHKPAESWHLLQTILTDLEANLYSRTRRIETVATAEKFLMEKLIAPIHKSIAASTQLTELSKHEYLVVNGHTVPNAPAMLAGIDIPALAKTFDLTRACTPHGDLTMENIIYSPHHPRRYYLIDPLTPNVFESQFLDAGKLLQSFHVGYEFLTHLRRISINCNIVNFPVTTSQQYSALCDKLTRHLKATYGDSGWRQIQLMEIIQVARLLPYRVQHQPHAAAAYYGIFCQLLHGYLKQSQAVTTLAAVA